MKSGNKLRRAAFAAATALLAWAGHAHGATPGSSVITINTVTVGDIDNTANGLYGSVSYEYQIGKYEVTNAQYAAFLNAVGSSVVTSYGLYNSSGMSGTYGGITESGGVYSVKSGTDTNGFSWADKPVNYVSFYDAARFANWLTSGDTESGLYEFDSETHAFVGVADHATSSGWAIASEGEWYKAAYYDGNGTYRTYPVTAETLSQSVANYYSGGYAFSSPYLTEVGHYDEVEGAGSHYGTFQQGGKVREWTDTLVSGTSRVVRGGSFADSGSSLAASARGSGDGAIEGRSIGFRVVLLSSLDGPTVPEPSDLVLAMGVLMLGVGLWKRRGAARPL